MKINAINNYNYQTSNRKRYQTKNMQNNLNEGQNSELTFKAVDGKNVKKVTTAIGAAGGAVGAVAVGLAIAAPVVVGALSIVGGMLGGGTYGYMAGLGINKLFKIKDKDDTKKP